MEERNDNSSGSGSGSSPLTPEILKKFGHPADLEAKIDALLQKMTNQQIWHEARVGTFNCILLPPSIPFNTEHKSWEEAKGEGIKWVDDVFICLEENRELETARRRPRHLTLIMTSEFAFNRAPGMDRNGACPIPDWMEREIQEAVRAKLHQEKYRSHRIIFAFSCCSTHPPEKGGNDPRMLGINQVSIITPWKDLQRIEKLRPAEAGDDGWDPKKYKINKEPELSKEEDAKKKAENEVRAIPRPASRIFVDNFEPQNCTIAVGLGTCRDIMFEEYPDVSLVVCPAGALTERPFYNTQLEGFVINDAEYWDPQDDDSFLVDPARGPSGIREFEKREHGLQKRVFPTHTEFDPGLGLDYRYHYGPTFPNGELNKLIKLKRHGSDKLRGEIIITPTRPFPKRSSRKRSDKGQTTLYPPSTPPVSIFRKRAEYFQHPEVAAWDQNEANELFREINLFEKQILKNIVVNLFAEGAFAFSTETMDERLLLAMYKEWKGDEQRWSNLAEAFIEHKRDNGGN